MFKNDPRVIKAFKGARGTGTGWRRGLCPFCLERTGKEDRKGAWSIAESTGFWQCWKCSAKGRLKDKAFTFEEEPEVVEEGSPIVLPDGFLPLWEDPGLTARSTLDARNYLATRVLPEEAMESAGIGCVPGWGRVVMPITTYKSELCGWVARAYVRAERPYMYPRGFKRAETLYNERALNFSLQTPILVVEGVFDALAWWPDGVAVLGKPSQWQLDRLLASKRPVVFCLDGDAWREGWSYAMRLRLMGKEAGAVRLPPGTDPDELDCLQQAALESLNTLIVEL